MSANPEGKRGCHPRQLLRRLFRREETVHISVEPKEEEYQEEPHVYQVRQTDHGVYIDDITDGRHFFRTNPGEEGTGSWFWLQGEGSPFDEDASMPPGDHTDFLDSLVDTATNPPEQDTGIPPGDTTSS